MKLNKLTFSLFAAGLSSWALAAAPFTIQDIRIEGLQRTAPSTVLGHLPVKVGSTFTDGEGEQIIKNLYATGLFDDVRVEIMGNQVLLTVVERPIINTLTVTGGKTLPSDAIKKNLDSFGLAAIQPSDPKPSRGRPAAGVCQPRQALRHHHPRDFSSLA